MYSQLNSPETIPTVRQHADRPEQPARLQDRLWIDCRVASDTRGLAYYNVRWYDPTIARFTQADSIVPDGVQGWDRYAYALSDPVRYTDPSGHAADQGGSTAARWEDLFEAYREVAERATYRENNGWRKEYLSTVAAYYHTRAEDAPNAVVEDMLGLVQDKKAALLINGYDGIESAVSTAFDLSGFEAIGIATAGSNLVGATVPGIHGNSLESPRSTVLYELVDSTTGEHLKFGITSESNPLDRYTRDYMKDKRMIILDQGSRRDMYELEQSYVLNNPRGPLQFNNH